MDTKKPLKGFLDFDRLFKFLSKRAQPVPESRKEESPTSTSTKEDSRKNASPTKGA